MVDGRLLASGEEAGTPPDDRGFRPDVEGLRALAVALVVLYHAGVPGVSGGYVGVDVFFVISGFVITGLLLRERSGTGRTSILHFYARRFRRILPAATLVIGVTVVAAYLALGSVSGNGTADAGRWAAAFLSNFHFEAIGTNYFTASLPPSPLQNYWSLSVEEQYYLVYPTVFLVVAGVRRAWPLQTKLAVTLAAVIIASYWLSVTQTASHPTMAYFSPFTRAWELALGGLVAVSTRWLKKIPLPASAALTWGGLAAIVISGFTFTSQTPYPGSLVAIPCVGTALVIAAGVREPRRGAEWLLGLRPVGWLGRRSYSLYLWHWPILIIAAEHAGVIKLPLKDSLLWVLVALALSMITYRVVENPIRHLRVPSGETVLTGVAVVGVTLVALSFTISSHSASVADITVVPAPNQQALASQVAAAAHLNRVPRSIRPPLTEAATNYGGNAYPQCQADRDQSTVDICTLGDRSATDLMVLYGDSHALMWLPAFIAIATAAHWRLIVLGKPYCPASPVTVTNPPGVGAAGQPYEACLRWHTWAVREINRLAPQLVVFSQDTLYPTPDKVGPAAFTAQQWSHGLDALFSEFTTPGVRKVYLGNIPQLLQAAPVCLASHPNNAQACSGSVAATRRVLEPVDQATSTRDHVQYIDPTPWFCSQVCTAMIANYTVYLDQLHVTATYARYLEVVLGQSLALPPGH